MKDIIKCRHCKKEYSAIIGIDDLAIVDLDVVGFVEDSVECESFRKVQLCMDCYLKLIEFLNLQDCSDIIEYY